MKMRSAREPLGTHMLGPLNVPFQSQAVIEVSESDFDSETSETAYDWIGMFKGPNVCAQRFSCASHLHLTLVHQ